MASVTIDLSQLRPAQDWLDRLQKFDGDELLGGVIALTESQVRRRIEFEKTAPDGTPWPAWSRAYAEMQIGKAGSLLQASGALLDSIVSGVENGEAFVGSPLVYAAIHNDGGTTKPHRIVANEKRALSFGGRVMKAVNHPGSRVPARTYLGYSDENIDEVEAEARAFFEHLLQ